VSNATGDPEDSGMVWSGVVDPLVLVEVAAPDGSVLWLDQASGVQPPLSGDELPDYVTLSPEAGVAVVREQDEGGRPGGLVLDPETGAVYVDTDFDELVGVSVPATENLHDKRDKGADSVVAATTDNLIRPGAVFVCMQFFGKYDQISTYKRWGGPIGAGRSCADNECSVQRALHADNLQRPWQGSNLQHTVWEAVQNRPSGLAASGEWCLTRCFVRLVLFCVVLCRRVYGTNVRS
jgi:hypothetical protein